jgi:hypothetical protein
MANKRTRRARTQRADSCGGSNTRDVSATDQAAKASLPLRAKQAAIEKTEQPRINGRFTSAAQESPAPAEDAAPPPEATGEIEEADPAEVPPLERPRSWAKEREEAWTRLDRDTQEYLLEHDKTTSFEVRKAQNDAAERKEHDNGC